MTIEIIRPNSDENKEEKLNMGTRVKYEPKKPPAVVHKKSVALHKFKGLLDCETGSIKRQNV